MARPLVFSSAPVDLAKRMSPTSDFRLLPVQPPDQLSNPAAGIERRVDVGVARRHLEDRIPAARVELRVEVDVVEHVQHFEVELDIRASDEREALPNAH